MAIADSAIPGRFIEDGFFWETKHLCNINTQKAYLHDAALFKTVFFIVGEVLEEKRGIDCPYNYYVFYTQCSMLHSSMQRPCDGNVPSCA
jgi:hypothetical protein